MGFTPDEIIKMVSHDGGSKNLFAMQDNLEALKALGFESAQVRVLLGLI